MKDGQHDETIRRTMSYPIDNVRKCWMHREGNHLDAMKMFESMKEVWKMPKTALVRMMNRTERQQLTGK